jgi:hypothetical protein
MVPRPVAKEFKVFSEELSHHEGTFAFLVSIVLRQEVFQMTDREETPPRGIKGFVREQFKMFLSDPLSYAIDRFIQAFSIDRHRHHRRGDKDDSISRCPHRYLTRSEAYQREWARLRMRSYTLLCDLAFTMRLTLEGFSL